MTVHHTYHSSFSGNSTSGKMTIYNGKDVTFTWPVPVTESWRAEGTCSIQGHNWKATLVAYSDGSYKLLKWYGYDGYDLEFSVGSDGKPTFLNAVKVEMVGIILRLQQTHSWACILRINLLSAVIRTVVRSHSTLRILNLSSSLGEEQHSRLLTHL